MILFSYLLLYLMLQSKLAPILTDIIAAINIADIPSPASRFFSVLKLKDKKYAAHHVAEKL